MRPITLGLFVAFGTLGAACGYSLLKIAPYLSTDDASFYAAGFLAAFASALLVIRVFLNWVRTRDFRPFAWYRIAFGIIVLLLIRAAVFHDGAV